MTEVAIKELLFPVELLQHLKPIGSVSAVMDAVCTTFVVNYTENIKKHPPRHNNLDCTLTLKGRKQTCFFPLEAGTSITSGES